jgi:crossover junction endodeoxyribonuclease RuvC
MAHPIRILGIDPGLRITGWGVIDVLGSSYIHVGHGILTSCEKDPLSTRLNSLYIQLTDIIRHLAPHEAAVEEIFVNKNPISALKLGAARGIALLAPAHAGLIVAEYAPNKIKKSVVGAGHADKDQIALMVNHFLPKSGGVTKDAADALAVALCHAHYRTLPTTLRAAL